MFFRAKEVLYFIPQIPGQSTRFIKTVTTLETFQAHFTVYPIAELQVLLLTAQTQGNIHLISPTIFQELQKRIPYK